MDEKIRILTVDDEPLALRRLTLELQTFADVDVVGSARDGDAAIDEARRLSPDLVILDVEMPGRDGLAVASELLKDGKIEIIILSAFDRYATNAFEFEALDYLLKPLRRSRLRQAIDRAQRRRAERAAHVALTMEESAKQRAQPSLHIPDRQGGRDVPLAAVVWVEAARDYVLIHTGTRTHMLRAKMSELEAILPPSIMRVHRSAFVALPHVRYWGTQTKGTPRLVLSDASEVNVGPAYLQEVRTALKSLDL